MTQLKSIDKMRMVKTIFNKDIIKDSIKTSMENNTNINKMYFMMKRSIGAKLLLMTILFALAPSIVLNAQQIVGYNYVTKIGGNMVTTQSGLTIEAGQEIEYVLELHNVSASSPITRDVKIVIPYFADFHSAGARLGTVTHLAGDTIRWNLVNVPLPTNDTLLLTYTLVATTDCHALNNNCINRIEVTGSINGATTYFYYGYNGVTNTVPTIVGLNTTYINCSLVGFREYVYLENKTFGANVSFDSIKGDFPRGVSFYDTITSAGATIGSPITTFRIDTARKRAYFAHLNTGCWEKFYINVLDTSDLVFCAGETLEKAVVWADDWDALKKTGKWYLDNVPVGSLSTPLTFADSGKILKYVDTMICGNADVPSNLLKIIVHDKPQILAFNYDTDYCVGNTINVSANVNQKDDSAHYAWYFKGVLLTSGYGITSASYTTPLVQTDSGQFIRLVVTNSCGTVTDSVVVRVHLLPSVNITGTTTVCRTSSTTLSGTPSGGTWKSLNTSVATINSSGVVTGVTVGTATIWYIYKNGSDCTDSASVTVTVNPTPRVADTTLIICSGGSFAVTPTNNGGTSGDDIVPAGTTYAWTVPTNSLGATSGSGSTINQSVLTNTTALKDTVVYTVTPTTGSCAGTSFKVTVVVNPKPYIADTTITVCSKSAFTFTPTNGGGTGNNIVPTGTTYSWNTPSATGITGASSGSGATNINQTLTNTTNSDKSITYRVVPVSNSTPACTGDTFSIAVTVKPTPVISDTTVIICSGATLTLAQTNGGGRANTNIVPSGITYTWTVSTNSLGATSQSSPQASISQTLTNTRNTRDTVIYTIIPIAGNCTGAAFNDTVVVNPKPELTVKVDTICSGSALSRPVVTTVAGTTFTWSRAAMVGIAQAAVSNSTATTITETLTDTTDNPINVPYIFTLTANGCTYNDTLIVTVNPKPRLSSPDTLVTKCSGNPIAYTVSSPTQGMTLLDSYVWRRLANSYMTPPTSSGTGDINETIVSSNPNADTVYYEYTLKTDKNCITIDTIRLIINPSGAALSLNSADTMPTICSADTARYTATSATSGAAFSWTRIANPNITTAHPTTGTGAAIAHYLKNNTNDTVRVFYVFEVAANGCSNLDTVSVLVRPNAIIANKKDTICSGSAFSISLTGDVVPTNTVYKWTISSNSNITGASAVTAPQASVTQTLANTTNIRQMITYTVIPISVTGADSCIGEAFTVEVAVNPKPRITDTTVIICNKATFTVTPINGGGSGSNNIVPSGISYTWVVPTNSLGATSQGTSQANISQALTNATTAVDTVIYSVKAQSGDCVDSFKVTVVVHPTPKLSSKKTDTICSEIPYLYQATSLTKDTTYSWSRASVAGITPATKSGSTSTIIDTLKNGTAAAIDVTYIITLTANGCSYNDTLILTVNPKPVLSNLVDTMPTICSGDTARYTATCATSGVSYSWVRLANASISTPTSSGTTNVVNEQLVNTSNTIPTRVYYVFTLTSDKNCANAATDTVSIIVNPLPSLSITDNYPTCVGDTLTLTGSPANGTWQSLTTSIATIGASNGKLVGLVGGAATVQYTFTNQYGCVDSLTENVTIKPLPVINITGSSSICVGTTTQLSPTTGGTWVSNNPGVASVDASGLVRGLATGKATFTFTDGITGCEKTTDTVEVGTFPVVAPITGETAVCGNGSDSVKLECATVGGVWTLNNYTDATIASQTNNPTPATATIKGNNVGKVYVTYTVGTGTCQTKSTFLLKVVSATPPNIIIGIER